MTRHIFANVMLGFSVSLCVAADVDPQAAREAAVRALNKNEVNIAPADATLEMGGRQIHLGLKKNGEVGNSANDENLALAAQLPELERVTLYYGRFTAEGLAKLTALPNLKSISFLQPSVDPSVFAGLSKLKTLEEVRFIFYPINDGVLESMNELPNLMSFEVTGTGGEGDQLTVQAVTKFLSYRDDMRQLLLMSESLDDFNLQQIRRFRSMQRMILSSHKVTPTGWSELAILKKMRYLDLRGTSFNDESMAALEEMEELDTLILRDTQISDAGMPYLAGLTKLQDLALCGTKVTDSGMVHLQKLKGLRNFYVMRTPVTAKGLEFVPCKDEMSMMGVGQGTLSAKQFEEFYELFPDTQMFDPSGYWTRDRVQAAMKQLGKELPANPIPPTLTLAPQSQTVATGESVTFTAAATGTPTPRVRWRVGTDGGKTFQKIDNESTASLTLTAVMVSQSGAHYLVDFYNSEGSASAVATLTVTEMGKESPPTK